MLLDLGQRTKARGQRLIVLLEQDQGYGDSLYRALGPTLDAAHIESISTHTLFSSGDPRNFQPDGHYTLQANDLFAGRLRATIRAAPPAGALAASRAHARYCSPAPSGPSCLAAAFLERAT
jgi:hypothetical protein